MGGFLGELMEGLGDVGERELLGELVLVLLELAGEGVQALG